MGEIILRPTPPVPLHFTGERLTSEYGGQTQIEHMHRYLLAREWCRGKDVLDVASGEGYGTALLAQVASSAVGVELAQDAVAHASAAYETVNLSYLVGDARALPNPDAAFDVVVSFETIEHFAEQADFLKEVRRVLRPEGLFIVSTPDRDNYSPAETQPNPYHVQELTGVEFEQLLKLYFPTVSILSQRPVHGSLMFPNDAGDASPLCFERRGDRHFEGSAGMSRPQYLIAFASNQPEIALPASVYIDTGRLGMLSPPEAEARLRTVQSALERAETQNGHLESQLSRLEIAERAAQAQIETYASAAQNHASEIEAIRDEVARRDLAMQDAHAELARRDFAMQDAHAEIEVYRAAAHERGLELEALRTDLADARGEARGLLAATQKSESAGLILREERDRAVRAIAEAEAAALRAQAEARDAVRLLEAKSAAAHERAARAEEWVASLYASTSWRFSRPIRAIGRRLRRH